MTIDEIKELIRVVHDTGISELEVQRGDNRVRIRSGATFSTQDIMLAPQGASHVAPAHAAHSGPPASADHHSHTSLSPAGQPREDENLFLVKSPIVGTYYDAPSPSVPSFVRVGDVVEPKQVLCIIESMKLMNEIEAEVAGTVVAKLVENGRPVEYGEALFRIRPR